MAGKGGQTIIIKKIKKGGHGHHGGAWKVAYADFVTAMMAFFLLLWILTATPVESLEGLADYFSPTMGVQGKMGIGFSGGASPNTEGWSKGDWASLGLIFGAPPSGPIIKMPDQDNYAEDNDPIKLKAMEESLKDAIDNTPELKDDKDSVSIENTPEGIRINIKDRADRPMFEPGTANLTVPTKKILAKISNIVKVIPNYIKITGHTIADKEYQNDDYSAWELSADRANAARRYLSTVGVSGSQIALIEGKGDGDPLNRDNPQDPANARISIVLLRKSILAYNKQPAPDDVILGPEQEGLNSFIQLKKKKQEDKAPAAEGGH